MRRLTTIGLRDDGWRGSDFGPDIEEMLTRLRDVEAHIEREVDEWTLLVLRLNAEGESTTQKKTKRAP